MSVFLIACLISAASQVGGIEKALMFYDGDCDGGNVSKLNMALHLLINVVSTLVLASSNFFMQVLNSPSREEVNTAHFKGSWMGIGIPSVRNAFKVSRFKTLCWICLFISSIPMHLLFNSTVFQTDRRDSDFHITIATEEFLNGGSFFPPGASLAQPGFDTYSYSSLSFDTFSYSNLMDGWLYPIDMKPEHLGNGFGVPVNLTEYADRSSDAMKNISNIALRAGQWERLEIQECRRQYIDCSGLKHQRSLVLVADKPGGWIRNDMWHLMDNQTNFWSRYVPSDQPNHLFYDAQCLMLAQHIYDQPTNCINNCFQALGQSSDLNSAEITELLNQPNWEYPFFDRESIISVNGTNVNTTFFADGSSYTFVRGSTLTSGLQPGTFNISVKYCLAEPLERVCHIALSPTLLLAVTMCVIFKTCTATLVTIVLSRRNQAPLVTLGDAMESFIEKPDPVTAGLCTMGQAEMRTATMSKKAILLPGPRQWKILRRRRGVVIPRSVWLMSYLLFGLGIGVCGYFFNTILASSQLIGSFFESEQNSFINSPFTFFEGVMLANSPQLLLSVCYLTYNNMFTRLQMAREWSLFSEGYQGLRVTDPKGDQYSTYRLQLPYKYSVPLIMISIFLHWLLSNTIYLFISIGGYFGTDRFVTSRFMDPSLPPSTAIAVGFSGYSLMGMLIVSCVLILVPPILSFKRLPSNMVNIGSNSLAISAACHVSNLSHAVKPREESLHPQSPFIDSPESSGFNLPLTPRSPERSRTLSPRTYTDETNGDGIELRNFTTTSTRKSSHLSLASYSSNRLLLDRSDDGNRNAGYEQSSPFRKLARSKIRWGVVEMPPEWHSEYEIDDGAVGHLSFGVEEDNIKPPESGQWYA